MLIIILYKDCDVMFGYNKKKITITEEEYLYSKERLEFIENERRCLKDSHSDKVYNAHIILPGTFDELKINLQRKNLIIDQKIASLKNKYLELYHYSEKVNSILDQCISLLENACYQSQTFEEDFFDNLDPKFDDFIQQIRKLLSYKKGHSTLLQYILDLEQEEKNAKNLYLYMKSKKIKNLHFFEDNLFSFFSCKFNLKSNGFIPFIIICCNIFS